MGDGLPISRQCELAFVPRSSYYYKPMSESTLNLELMTPFYGIPRMTAFLRSRGFNVNHKRIERLMSLMGIHAIYPKKRLSDATRAYKVYPYLLKDLEISYPDQVWCSDITYIRMRRGFAIMDWYSRYVLSWRLLLLSQGILISMDGRGRVFDNIFIERRWRTLRYEEAYLKKRDVTSKINMPAEKEETKLRNASSLS